MPEDRLAAAGEAAAEEDVVAEAMGIVEQSAADGVTITAEADGPLAVSGPVRVLAADGSVLEEAEQVWLCRCGQREQALL